jgi:hypothetical protein
MTNQTAPTPDLPDLWDDAPLRAYLGEMSRRHGVVDSLALPNMRDMPSIRLDKLFVYPQLSTTPVNPATPVDKWPDGLNLFGSLEAAPRLVVLGDPGAGKTTLTNWLAWRLSVGMVGKLPDMLEQRLPIHCVLRELQFDADTSLSDLVLLVAQRLLGPCDDKLRTRLHAWVAAKRYVLILDGVDEISTGRRKVVTAWMRQAQADDAVVLATSRLVGYDDAPVDCPPAPTLAGMSMRGAAALLDSGRAAVRRQPHAGENEQEQEQEREPGWAERRYLMPFDDRRIAAFVGNWYLQRSGSEQEAKQRAADLLAALGNSEVMQELARTPNLLSLMAIVHRERAHLPDGRALLYKEIANAYINTIDQHRKIAVNDPLTPYGWEARENWLGYVGFRMQCERAAAEGDKSDAGVLVSEQTVLAWLTEAMQASGVSDVACSAELFLSWVARRSGLLLPRGEGVYAFVHLSFQEYFCARYLLGRVTSPAFVKGKLGPDAPVTPARLAEWGNEYLWRESLVYLLELMSSERDNDWVAELVEILFGGVEQDDDLGGNQAEFAARVLDDRHIHVSEQWKRSLARRCSWLAALYWAGWHGHYNTRVLHPMMRAGYAAIVGAGDDELGALSLRSMDEVINPADLFVLAVRDDALTALPSLDEMRSLRYLYLSGTQVQDVSALAGLTGLLSLDLNDTQVQDVSALAGLTGLLSLDLSGTQVQDVSALVGMTGLQHLVLNDLQNIDTSALTAALPKLKIYRL